MVPIPTPSGRPRMVGSPSGRPRVVGTPTGRSPSGRNSEWSKPEWSELRMVVTENRLTIIYKLLNSDY